MKVLIIGGAGYIGSVLSHHLWNMGHSVTVFDNLLFGGESLLPLLEKDRFQLVPGDLRDSGKIAEIIPGHDAVVLLAAIVGEPACNRAKETAMETNLKGALHVLQVTKEAGVPRFIFSSTCSNYGVSDPDQMVDETAPLHPLSTYSETKVTAERTILASKSSSFHPTVLRFSTAFGVSPRMRFDLLISDFTLAAVRERKIVIYGEQFWRPFVHIQDISEAIEMVMEADSSLVSGEVFNVGGNENNLQKIDLGIAVQKIVPGTELEFVKRDTDPRSYRVDFSKIANKLAYRPKWTIDDGIKEVYAALKAGIWPNPSDSRFYN